MGGCGLRNRSDLCPSLGLAWRIDVYEAPEDLSRSHDRSSCDSSSPASAPSYRAGALSGQRQTVDAPGSVVTSPVCSSKRRAEDWCSHPASHVLLSSSHAGGADVRGSSACWTSGSDDDAAV